MTDDREAIRRALEKAAPFVEVALRDEGLPGYAVELHAAGSARQEDEERLPRIVIARKL